MQFTNLNQCLAGCFTCNEMNEFIDTNCAMSCYSKWFSKYRISKSDIDCVRQTVDSKSG